MILHDRKEVKEQNFITKGCFVCKRIKKLLIKNGGRMENQDLVAVNCKRNCGIRIALWPKISPPCSDISS